MKVLNKLAVALIFVSLSFFATDLLTAQQLPPPEAVEIDKLGFMTGFPPSGEKVINAQNKNKYPQLRWVLQHSRELGPTKNIRRGSGPVSPLPQARRDLDNFIFEDEKGEKITVLQWLKKTYTDAIVVLHKGRIVYERYFNEGAAYNPHMLFSITKSFTGLLAAQLIQEGRLSADDMVVKYIPELADSAWGDMKVHHVLDMTGAVQFREVYTDPTSEIFAYMYACNMIPPPPNYTGPRTIYDFLKTLKKGGEHGKGFVYRTVHSEVLGWIVSRVTGKHFTDLLSERIWQRLGMEEDAYVAIDPVGTPWQGSGMSATARDLARVGEMIRKNGYWNGQSIFHPAVVEDLRRGGDREKFKASGMDFRAGYSYHNQWWIVHNADGAFEASGVHGQMLHINPAAEMVVVKLSSHPVASAAFTHALTLRAFTALARAVRQ
ncbi:MAG: beta-lactamase family protein [Syntrophales bacterium]|nr:beta-lactamase family protein [Syntrophales bacterium]